MDVDDERKYILDIHSQENEGNDAAHSLNVYKRRWWVAFVFCYAGFTQALIWNTWGPIAESSELVFGWTDGKLAQITNMSGIIFIIFVLPFGSFMDAKGLRFMMVVCLILLFACTLIRCFTMDPEIFTPLAYLSSALQGIGGLAAFSGVALFAASWFPLNERASVTALVTFFNYFGVTIGFITEPKLVPDPVYVLPTNNYTTKFPTNALERNGENTTSANDRNLNLVVANTESMKAGIQHLLYLHAALSALALFLVVVYFPAKPPKPPSITASLPRTDYKAAYMGILRNVQLWIIVMAGALPRSFVGSWIAIFDVIVKPLGVSQIDAGWIAFWHMLVGCLAGMAFAKFSDFLKSRRKELVISMSIVGGVCSIWAALLCNRIIDFSMESLYASCILMGLFVNGLAPLFFEMSAETAYPVGEGVAGGLFSFWIAAFGIIFLGLLSIPGIGVSWMAWACVGSLGVSLPLMIIFKERNKRYDIDKDCNK